LCHASVHVRVRHSRTASVWTRLKLSVPEASPRLVAGRRDNPVVRTENPDLGQVFSASVLPTKHDCV